MSAGDTASQTPATAAGSQPAMNPDLLGTITLLGRPNLELTYLRDSLSLVTADDQNGLQIAVAVRSDQDDTQVYLWSL